MRHPYVHPSLLALAIALSPACGGEPGTSDLFTTGTSSSAPGSTGEPSTGASGAGSSGTGASGDSGSAGSGGSGSPKFDVGQGGMTTGGGDGGGGDMGCRGIDFLFVVDNSGSMIDEQLALVSSFTGFVDAIENTLMDDQAKDFHVMVVDTDGGENFSPAPAPGTCEQKIGAGLVTKTDWTPCGFPDGRRYMTNADPNLPSAFGCVAFVGTGGNGSERPMDAMTQALGPLAAAGACNEGFLREDAILVVTVISDEDDVASMGEPTDWYDALVAAKGGDASAIILLGLLWDATYPGSTCPGGSPAERLIELVEAFAGAGQLGSVCAESYDAFFADAVGVIDQSCQDFVPPQG